MLSAVKFGEQFGPRSGPEKKIGPEPDPNCLTLRWLVFPKKMILKKISRQQKGMQNYPEGKELKKPKSIYYPALYKAYRKYLVLPFLLKFNLICMCKLFSIKHFTGTTSFFC